MRTEGTPLPWTERAPGSLNPDVNPGRAQAGVASCGIPRLCLSGTSGSEDLSLRRGSLGKQRKESQALPGVEVRTPSEDLRKPLPLDCERTPRNHALPGIPGIPGLCWHDVTYSYGVTQGWGTWSKGYGLGPAVGRFPGFSRDQVNTLRTKGTTYPITIEFIPYSQPQKTKDRYGQMRRISLSPRGFRVVLALV